MESDRLGRQYAVDLREIRTRLLEMGGMVELMLADSARSVIERNCALARHTIDTDEEINRLELEIDERCLQLFARRQPAARDLRFVTLALKIVTDLERIGDQCTSIARHALALNEEPPVKSYIDLPGISQMAISLVKGALDAFVREDPVLAAKVCAGDRLVDELCEQAHGELLSFMAEDPRNIGRAMRIEAIFKKLERIADHATNIAEMVIFMVNGSDIRHARAV